MGASQRYQEGDLFAVPIRESTWAVGVVARMSKENRGVVLGYFYSTIYEHPPLHWPAPAYPNPAAPDAILRFGDHGIISGRWPIIGGLPEWNPVDWPMPTFANRPIVSSRHGVWLEETYYQDDPNRVLSSAPISVALALNLPPAELCGYKSVEKRLARIFLNQEPMIN